MVEKIGQSKVQEQIEEMKFNISQIDSMISNKTNMQQ